MRRPDFDDVFIPVGLVLIPVGVGLWSIPLALVVLGVECVAFGFLMGRSE